ncbi:unnamed protein product [Mycetohabitans rhizoxinica HKI 454]|uniref:Uncharacterized protein n=1 Tax=Mycetohabitans rhizoxinica (strain DSM 19002 / CIP 109453 / HKI 454) TaxID=882378 RepID=E5AQE9_MYCRK|nr:unnamed protein product [Mycetohabitans rhizoxinica HKI 454]
MSRARIHRLLPFFCIAVNDYEACESAQKHIVR